MKKIMDFFKNYSYLWVVPVYFVLYMTWFFYLETRNINSFHIIHMAVDDLIPFNEFFIIPYYLWFLFIPASVLLMIMSGKEDFSRLFTFLSFGMTLFLIISTIYPNGALLRPSVFPRDNIFTHMVMGLYSTDTSTNLFPSIHVYNSLGAVFAILKCEKYNKNKALRISSVVLCALIILSTLFLKQHSVFDVITGIMLSAVMYLAVWELDVNFLSSRNSAKRSSRQRHIA